MNSDGGEGRELTGPAGPTDHGDLGPTGPTGPTNHSDLTSPADHSNHTSTADPTAPSPERRLHPVTPLRRAWAPFAVVAGWAVHDPDGAWRWLGDLAPLTLLAGFAGLLAVGVLYGFLTWWYTHFSVTGTELRIRTGLLFRRTAHIRLDRLQAVDVTRPLLARVLGVAKLRLDVVGADKKDELAYLSEPQARALRGELLARAAGLAPHTAAEVGEAPAEQLVRVPPRSLAVALLLTGGPWLALLGALAVSAVLWFTTHNPVTVLVTGVPLLGAAGTRTFGRFLAEYDWTLADSPDGLRIDRGLFDRAHETVPPGRVQTVRLVEPVLWRRRGWVRVELNVAGSANTVLIPVAPRPLAEAVVTRVLPSVTVPDAFTRPPRRARWAVPLWWRGHGLAVTDGVFATRKGLFKRTVYLVPHAKVQSVRLTWGPWLRALDLADLHVDTGANKTVTARLRPADEASAGLLAQADRSRTGRRDAGPDRWMTGRTGG